MRIPALDLFSGIGGFSYALHSICKTVAYCESDPDCQQVLKKNMHAKRIDFAPIHPDVTALTSADLPQGVKIVFAGFPCQDISVAGNRVGLSGPRSGLFQHIIRLVRDMPGVQYLFLENVPNIVHNGFPVVVKQLSGLGFSFSCGMFQSNEIGAPHKRKRWFLLASRNNAAPLDIVKSPINAWKTEPPRLIAKSACVNAKPRWKMLGNSIVPQCAAFAWNTLIAKHYEPDVVKSTVSVSKIGIIMTQNARKKPKFFIRPLQFSIRKDKLLFPGGLEKKLWATPTAGFNNHYNKFNSTRGMKNIVNQVFYERSTLAIYNVTSVRELTDKYVVDPSFIEWLMGYPKNWTATR